MNKRFRFLSCFILHHSSFIRVLESGSKHSYQRFRVFDFLLRHPGVSLSDQLLAALAAKFLSQPSSSCCRIKTHLSALKKLHRF